MCALFIGSTSPPGYAHGERDIFAVKGALTKIDLANQVIELDTVDRKTKLTRNLMFFVAKKVKIRDGKTPVELGALRPGQRVTCTVETEHSEDDGTERSTVFEIRLDGL